MANLKEKDIRGMGHEGKKKAEKNMPYMRYFLSQTGQSLCAVLYCNDSSPPSSRLLLGNPHVSDSSEK